MKHYNIQHVARTYPLMLVMLLVGIAAGAALSLRFLPSSPTTSMVGGSPAATAAVPEAVAPPQAASVEVPILVYHIVRPSYPSDSAEVRIFAVTPEEFDAQLAYLQSNGYHVIPFSALEEYFSKGTPLPSHPIIINFDDAWEDQYVYALPILEKYHDTATFFVPSNWVGAKRAFLTWDQLHEMLALGMTIGSHSRSHPMLATVTDPKVLVDEIQNSKDILEKKLGITIHEFDYPYGSFNAAAVAAVKAAGYQAARTQIFGRTHTVQDMFTLSAINAPTTIPAFKRTFPPLRAL